MSKLDEANDLIVKANKCFKTSFFNRTPDYDSAIEYFKNAGLIFRNCKMFKEAAETYEKLAKTYYQNGSHFNCAKQYETSAQMYRELKDYPKMVSLITEAGKMLQENGTPDSASYVYQRAARSLHEILPESAAMFYEKSYVTCEIEEKFHEATDMANNAARIWVRLQNFTEAERLLRLYMDCVQRGNTDSVSANVGGFADIKAVPKLCGRAVVVLIMISLKKQDEIAANKIFNEAVQKWRFTEADEFLPIKRLLFAVEQMDNVACLEAVKDPSFRCLDLDYVHLIMKIKFPYPDQTQTSSSPVRSTSWGDGNEDQDEQDIC